MKKVYLISWCDDNHDPFYWLNENSLGWGMDTIVENIINLGLPKGTEVQEVNITGDNFPEDIWEQLFDYFQTIPNLDSTDVHLIVMNKWEDFYKKNIKKIMRKIM